MILCFALASCATFLFTLGSNEAILFVSVGLIYTNTEQVMQIECCRSDEGCWLQVWSTITTYSSVRDLCSVICSFNQCSQEAYPTELRNSAVGIIHGVSVIGAVANVAITPGLMDAVDTRFPFYLNSLMFLVGAGVTMRLRIETKDQPIG